MHIGTQVHILNQTLTIPVLMIVCISAKMNFEKKEHDEKKKLLAKHFE